MSRRLRLIALRLGGIFDSSLDGNQIAPITSSPGQHMCLLGASKHVTNSTFECAILQLSIASMSTLERDAFHKLRQRWARENFGTSLDSASQSRLRLDEEAEPMGGLSEVTTPKPEPARTRSSKSSKAKHSSKSSWTASLCGKLDEELSEIRAPPPLRLPSGRSTRGRSFNPSALPPIPSEEYQPPKTQSRWLNELYTVSWLIFFSILGTLARLGVEALTQYPSAPVTSRILWANLGGSFFMGFLLEDRNLFRQTKPQVSDRKRGLAEVRAAHVQYKKTIPLYVGLTTGFCGSFTSFSSFMSDAFLALTNALDTPSPTVPYRSVSKTYPRHGGFSFLAVTSVLILHPAISISAMKAGIQFANLTSAIMRPIPEKLLSRFLNPLILLLGIGSWLGITLGLTISPPYPFTVDIINWRARALLPMLFAPPGCLLRYYISRCANGIFPKFPLGTFVANMTATAVVGTAFDLQHAANIRSLNICSILAGVIDGFCGSLGAVSTWVVEMEYLPRKWAWIYGLSSVSFGLGLLVCIMGGMGWTIGFVDARCG